MQDKNLIKIGDLARSSNLSERSLRHYEELGIITPSRTKGGTRAYTQQDIAVAKLVQRMRDIGISLDQISSIATARAEHETGAKSAKAVRRQLLALSNNLMKMARMAIELESEVTEVIMAVDECLSCENKASNTGCPTCPMNEVSKESSLADLIWRD
ncbi:MerR family transcriptional regulator [Lentibacter algarum]|uniref:MerR family transcriptional regulator n=1 Tax=Lentibacter algarum TaxID=576131 RepID=UPI001C0A0448|nr:MerR family transcriptional regulator [Lentibacter algarum]MBU2983295.1 MerR family transcriptional regulator [Lentibacter algarum]